MTTYTALPIQTKKEETFPILENIPDDTKVINFRMRRKIIYNVVNVLLFGLALFIGSVIGSGSITLKGVVVAFLGSFLATIIKFNQFWEKEQPDFYASILTII